MIEFKVPEISDKKWVDEILSKTSQLGCEYTFGNMFCWYCAFKTLIGRYKDFFILKGVTEQGVFYGFPVGTGDIYETIEVLRKDAKEQGNVLKFFNATPYMIDILNKKYKDEFKSFPKRERYDYIYNSSDLINLEGKKYHSKRNFINRFLRENPDWVYEDINKDNITECKDMHKKWKHLNGNTDKDTNGEEKCALKSAIDNYEELDLLGGLIRAKDEIVAFTIGEQLSDETFVIHFEKAFSNITGTYPMINNQFAKINLSKYKYINREEDIGEEGLRKAKLSYYPEILLEKNIVIFNN